MKTVIFLLLVASAIAVARTHLETKTSFTWSNGRIAGGTATNITEFPHQISMQRYNRHYCGGSIISEKYVVTAAHCTDGYKPEELFVRYNTSIVEKGGVLVEVAAIYQNPNFEPGFHNDISILELAENITFGPGAQAIALPDDNITVGATVTVSGWGGFYDTDVNTEQLHAADVNVIDLDECRKDYEHYRFNVEEGVICASVPAGGIDACKGDSGGPLIAYGKLYGIVTYRFICGHAEYPGVYTDVVYYRDFINEITGL